MEKGSDIRFLRWALPAATAVFLAAAALLWYWPDIRAPLAWRALEAGDYARARMGRGVGDGAGPGAVCGRMLCRGLRAGGRGALC